MSAMRPRQVRCSGEKTGCQRCGNLRLKCAFSISRIGKVPGKRGKANRVAAAVTASSAPISTSSSSSMSTPIMSPPILTPALSFEIPKAYNGRNGIPAYPFTQEYPANRLPPVSEVHHPHLLPGYPTQSNPEDFNSLSNLCWTTELDQLGGPGMLSPDWEIDADESIPPPQSHTASTSISGYPDLLPDEENVCRTYASPVEIFPSAQYTIYIHLLHSIEQTIQFFNHCRSPGVESMHASTLDSILAANQKYLTTLLQISDSQAFTHTYNEEHLLFSVALDKIIYLFGLGYKNFKRRIEVYEGMGISCAGPMNRWIRFGAFEIDFAEQMAICRREFVEEIKRAMACLGRLMDAMGCITMSISTSPGRHEGLCEEMKRRLDGLMDDIEGDLGFHGTHLLG
ncbi:hypothetical protein BDW59DRAFT_158339 [Aspergillus cavernicola]|uniref:Zn(2)-C6 fungal-type domain-containing protein n=1 Tax=Aspergillus cavernicola TaxID=176166 RepID=A0ABR4IT16_9EURO